MVLGLILAAGRGERFGATKQLAELGGTPLLRHVVTAARAGGLQDIVVVLGHAAEEVIVALDLPTGTRVIVNDRFAEGQSTSLRAGLAAAPDEATAVIVLLGDQPEVRPDAIRALVEAYRSRPAPIVRAAYAGKPGHPILFDRQMWSELSATQGDAGARTVIARHSEHVAWIEVGGKPPEDVDTPEDLTRLRERWRTRRA
jgi:molybdenum cofactor cytidylyltransferase